MNSMPTAETERYSVLAAVALLVGSFALLLAASLSVPVLQTSQILTLRAVVDGETRSADFGIWGYCLKSIKNDGERASPRCTRGMVGWTIQSDVTEFLQVSDGSLNGLTEVETSMLVIYPAAAALTFICFIWFLSVHLTNRIRVRRSFQAIWDPPFSRPQFILGCLTALATFFVFLVHVELVTSTQKDIRTQLSHTSPTMQLDWGNSTWFCVAALVCLLGELFIVRNIRNARRNRKVQRLQVYPLPAVASAEKVSSTEVESHAMGGRL